MHKHTHTADAALSHSSVLVCERRDEPTEGWNIKKNTLALTLGEQTLIEGMLMHMKDV